MCLMSAVAAEKDGLRFGHGQTLRSHCDSLILDTAGRGPRNLVCSHSGNPVEAVVSQLSDSCKSTRVGARGEQLAITRRNGSALFWSLRRPERSVVHRKMTATTMCGGRSGRSRAYWTGVRVHEMTSLVRVTPPEEEPPYTNIRSCRTTVRQLPEEIVNPLYTIAVPLYAGSMDVVIAAPLVREARRAAGLSQVALAERLSTTQSAVSRWECGHDEPRLSTLRSILRACDRRLVLSSEPDSIGDVDRAQIRQQLAMSPEERLASVTNISTFVVNARRVD